MLFREDNVARADADAIRKGVGFYRWTHDIVEITGKDALEVLQKIYTYSRSMHAVSRWRTMLTSSPLQRVLPASPVQTLKT